jgi:hypothetical protein
MRTVWSPPRCQTDSHPANELSDRHDMTTTDFSPKEALTETFKVLRQGLGLHTDSQVRLLRHDALTLLGAQVDSSLGQQHARIHRAISDAIDQLQLGDDSLQVLRRTFNLTDEDLEWSDRLRKMAEAAHWSQRTVLRRVDQYFSSLAEILLRPPIDGAYNLDLGQFRDTVTRDGLSRVHIIVGTTTRERDMIPKDFTSSSITLPFGQTTLDITRQVLQGTVRDLVRIADLAAALATSSSVEDSTELCIADIAVSETQLRDHLVIVGGPDTNVFMAAASTALLARFGAPAPIRYQGEDSGYFTCDELRSDLSGSQYLRLEESGGMHCGYIVHALNPWNVDTTITLVSGIRATGTQAALLALVRSSDDFYRLGHREPWRRLDGNNRYNPTISAKVVRATQARIVNSEELISSANIFDVPPTMRISQRHAITGFVYEE